MIQAHVLVRIGTPYLIIGRTKFCVWLTFQKSISARAKDRLKQGFYRSRKTHVCSYKASINTMLHHVFVFGLKEVKNNSIHGRYSQGVLKANIKFHLVKIFAFYEAVEIIYKNFVSSIRSHCLQRQIKQSSVEMLHADTPSFLGLSECIHHP